MDALDKNVYIYVCVWHRFENEMAIRQSVEADIAGLKKLIDDTNIGRMNVESEIEALKEELLFLKKNHDNVSYFHLLCYYEMLNISCNLKVHLN